MGLRIAVEERPGSAWVGIESLADHQSAAAFHEGHPLDCQRQEGPGYNRVCNWGGCDDIGEGGVGSHSNPISQRSAAMAGTITCTYGAHWQCWAAQPPTPSRHSLPFADFRRKPGRNRPETASTPCPPPVRQPSVNGADPGAAAVANAASTAGAVVTNFPRVDRKLGRSVQGRGFLFNDNNEAQTRSLKWFSPF